MPRLSLGKAFLAAMEAVDKKVHWHTGRRATVYQPIPKILRAGTA